MRLAAGLGVALSLLVPRAHAAPPLPAIGPGLTVDRFMAGAPAEAQATIDSHIAKMRRLITVTADDDPQKPDFFLRLGDLYSEKYRFHAIRTRALAASMRTATQAQRMALDDERRAADSQHQRWLLEAVKAYIVATKYKSYERMDEVLFRLTAMLGSIGKDQQAGEFFLRLSRDYPTSKYVAAAEIALADGECQSGKVGDALPRYDRIAENGDPVLRAFTEYRKGWCILDHGQRAEVGQALESFVAAVRTLGAVPADDARARLLRPEATKDLARAYARTGGPERAWSFFRKVDAQAAPEMMRSLAGFYQEEGKLQDAARATELARSPQ